MKQARRIRDLTFRYLEAMQEPPADAGERARAGATLARLVDAWDTALDRLRILNNRPLPGQFRPEPKRKARRMAQSILPIVPLDAPAVSSAADTPPAPGA